VSESGFTSEQFWYKKIYLAILTINVKVHNITSLKYVWLTIHSITRFILNICKIIFILSMYVPVYVGLIISYDNVGKLILLEISV